MDTDEKLREILITLRDAEAENPQNKNAQNQLIKFLTQFPDVKKCRDTRIDCEVVMQEAYIGLLKTIKGFFLTIDLDNTSALKVRVRLIQRFNQIVKNKELDAYRKLKKQPFSLDNMLSQDSQGDTHLEQVSNEGFVGKKSYPTISLLDELIEIETETENKSIGSQLWQYINTDPEGKLQNCYPSEKIDKSQGNQPENMRPRPDVNCQVLAQRLHFKETPDKLSELARELDINYQTINAHWKKKCEPLLRELAINFGYKPEA
ncbi:MAG: hypothetical protein RLZZ338_4132 [Cyanobacteriota bacterium]|jgi:hypothetical protein